MSRVYTIVRRNEISVIFLRDSLEMCPVGSLCLNKNTQNKINARFVLLGSFRFWNESNCISFNVLLLAKISRVHELRLTSASLFCSAVYST